ncbi:MAG: DUF86 domain-containing protein [Dehalococcoidales bacterium]|nr:DUF86 domain-containing protein [Dehalococcoidales bacterium]
MPVVDDVSRLQHIIEATRKAQEFVKGKNRSDLDTDAMLSLALVRLLEIIGEAAWGISEKLRSKYPEIPWRAMTGMRNRLIHGYFDVNLDVVWDTVTTELPPLVAQMQKVLNKGVK